MTDENLQPETAAEGATALPEANADEVASPTTADTGPEVAPADDAGNAEKSNTAKRIDELTRLRREAERDAHYWRDQAMRTQKPETVPEPQQPAAPVKVPRLEDFEFDETKYQSAMRDFFAAEARREALAVIENERKAEREKATRETWQKRQESFKAKTPDYEDVAYTAPISDDIAKLIVALEEGPQVAYHLGKNPDLARQVSALPKEMAAIELGRLAARLGDPPPVPPVQRVTQAPPPPPRLDAVTDPVRKDPEQMDDGEWAKWNEKRKRKAK